MTKEELEKEKQELLDRYQEHGDKYAEFYIKKGFDSAVELLLPRLGEAESREVHLENCVEQLYDIIALSDFITKSESDMAIKIYNEAEIVVRKEK